MVGFLLLFLAKDFLPNLREWGSKMVAASMEHGSVLTISSLRCISRPENVNK